MRYTVVLTPDDGQIAVRVPALPGLFTWGKNRSEAMAAAREAIALYLEDYIEHGRPLPRDRKFRGKPVEGREIGTLEVNVPARSGAVTATHRVA